MLILTSVQSLLDDFHMKDRSLRGLMVGSGSTLSQYIIVKVFFRSAGCNEVLPLLISRTNGEEDIGPQIESLS